MALAISSSGYSELWTQIGRSPLLRCNMMSVKETQHYQSNKSRHKTGGSFVERCRNGPQETAPSRTKFAVCTAYCGHPPPPPSLSSSVHDRCMAACTSTSTPSGTSTSVRVLYASAAWLASLILLWMQLDLLAACGRWELGWLSGSPVSACSRGRDCSLEACTRLNVQAAQADRTPWSHQVHCSIGWNQSESCAR